MRHHAIPISTSNFHDAPREQAASLAVAGDLDELQRTVAVHKVIVDAVGIAETMLDAMSHKEEVSSFTIWPIQN